MVTAPKSYPMEEKEPYRKRRGYLEKIKKTLGTRLRERGGSVTPELSRVHS